MCGPTDTLAISGKRIRMHRIEKKPPDAKTAFCVVWPRMVIVPSCQCESGHHAAAPLNGV